MTLLRLILRAVQDDGNGTKGQPGSQTSGKGESLWKVIRLLVEMAPKERSALLGLLKALG